MQVSKLATEKRWTVFWWLTAAYFISYFFRSTNAVIATDLQKAVQLSKTDLGFMTACFYASFAVAQIFIGAALDTFGPRFVQPILLGIAVLGALVFGSGQSVLALAMGRALLGVGLGGSLMAAFKAFGFWFPAQSQATITGVLMGIGAFGALLAATPLAWASNHFGWRTIFVFGAVITALVALGIWVFVPSNQSQKTSGSLHLKDVLKNQNIFRIAIMNFFVAGGLLSLQTLWAGPFLEDDYALSKIVASNYLLLFNFGTALGYFVFGWLGDKFGLTRVAVICAFCLLLCQSILVFHVALTWMPIIYFLYGFVGTGNLLLLSHAKSLYPSALTGQATTFVNMFGIGGTFLLQWLFGVVVSQFGYATAFAMLAAGTALALVLYLPATQKPNKIATI